MSEDVQLSVSIAQFGEVRRDVEGRELVIPHDMVILGPVVNGQQLSTYQMTPEQAIALAQALAKQAGELINKEVDDQGKPTRLVHRLRRLGAQA